MSWKLWVRVEDYADGKADAQQWTQVGFTTRAMDHQHLKTQKFAIEINPQCDGKWKEALVHELD